MESSQAAWAARASAAVPHSDTTVPQTATPPAPDNAPSSNREELKVLFVGSEQEQDALCRAANIQKQQPSIDEDVYVNGKREPVMQRDQHLSPNNDVVKKVRMQPHFEDPATSVQRSASVRLIHCIVCVLSWTGDAGSINSRVSKMRNKIVESWFLSEKCKSDEARVEDFPVLVVVLNPGPLSLEAFSLRVDEQLPYATVVSAFEVNKSGYPQAKPGFAQEFTHTLAFMADKFSLKMRNASVMCSRASLNLPPRSSRGRKRDQRRKSPVALYCDLEKNQCAAASRPLHRGGILPPSLSNTVLVLFRLQILFLRFLDSLRGNGQIGSFVQKASFIFPLRLCTIGGRTKKSFYIFPPSLSFLLPL